MSESGTGTTASVGYRNDACLPSVTVVTACLKEMIICIAVYVFEENRGFRSGTSTGQVKSVARMFTFEGLIEKVLFVYGRLIFVCVTVQCNMNRQVRKCWKEIL